MLQVYPPVLSVLLARSETPLEQLCALIVLLATAVQHLAQQPPLYVLQVIMHMPNSMSVMNVHVENTVLCLEHNGAPHVLLVPTPLLMLAHLAYPAPKDIFLMSHLCLLVLAVLPARLETPLQRRCALIAMLARLLADRERPSALNAKRAPSTLQPRARRALKALPTTLWYALAKAITMGRAPHARRVPPTPFQMGKTPPHL